MTVSFISRSFSQPVSRALKHATSLSIRDFSDSQTRKTTRRARATFFVFTPVLLCARRDGAMKGPVEQKAQKLPRTGAMAADIAPALSLINKICCSTSSSELAKELVFITEIVREAWRCRGEGEIFIFAHQSLINSAKFALTVAGRKSRRTKRSKRAPLYFCRARNFCRGRKRDDDDRFTKSIESTSRIGVNRRRSVAMRFA